MGVMNYKLRLLNVKISVDECRDMKGVEKWAAGWYGGPPTTPFTYFCVDFFLCVNACIPDTA